MRSIVFLFVFVCIIISCNTFLFAQNIQINYPTKLDSYKNQVLNIPIICENNSQSSVTLLPDLIFDITGYQINNISPKSIASYDREIIFISVIPEDYLLAGNRVIPFALRDISGKIHAEGLFEIQHHVNTGFEIIPLNLPDYLISDKEYEVSLFIRNTGSVPLEALFFDTDSKHLLQPAAADTIYLKINNLYKEQWYDLSLDYQLTQIMPTDLITTNHNYRKIIPIASKSDSRGKFNTIPINFRQKIYYDKSSNFSKSYFRQHTTTVSGFGYLGNYPSPLVGFYINHKYSHFNKKTEDETSFNFFIKSKHLNATAGEGSYKLDLNRQNKQGNGYDIKLKTNHLIFQHNFLKELYKDRPVHTLHAFGYTWETEQYQYEPLQYIMFKYYKKHNRSHDDKWYSLSHHHSIEHEKYILNTQFKAFENLMLNIEIFTVKDSVMQKQSSPNYAGEVTYKDKNLYYRFYALTDKSNTLNEYNYRYRLNKDVNFNSEVFDIYASWLYYDEKNKPDGINNYHNLNQNLYLTTYLNLLPKLYLKSRFFIAETNIYSPAKSNFKDNELVYGLHIKNGNSISEILYGYRKEDYREKVNRQLVEFNMHFFVENNFNMLINNQVSQSKEKKLNEELKHIKMSSNIQANINWSSSLSHNIGINNIYHNQNVWQNYLNLFTNFIYTFKWKHSLRSGFNYGLNPRISNAQGTSNPYKFSCYAEYSMPLQLPVSRKDTSKHVNISIFDPWQQKPVSGAIFKYNNLYYVSNEKGNATIKRDHTPPSKLHPPQLSILNLPTGFSVSPGLSDTSTHISNSKTKSVELNIIQLSEIELQLIIKKYETLSPNYSKAYAEDIQTAYQNKRLINLNNYELQPLKARIEVILSNEDEVITVTTNQNGIAHIKNLRPGIWTISIKENNLNERLGLMKFDKILIENNHTKISLTQGEKTEHQIIFFDNYQNFIKFDTEK